MHRCPAPSFSECYSDFMLGRKFFALCLSLLFFPAIARPVLAAEQIDLFSSKIRINADTSISIEETIRYQTDEDKHGIFRYIPYRYAQRGANYTARITGAAVTDGEGKKLPFSASKQVGNCLLECLQP